MGNDFGLGFPRNWARKFCRGLASCYDCDEWDELYESLKKADSLPPERKKELRKEFMEWQPYGEFYRVLQLLNAIPDMTIFLNFLPVNTQECRGRTMLHYAVGHGCFRIAERLLNHGANPNIPDIYGNTPAFWARDGKMLLLLENYGADFRIKNQSGNSVIDNALQYVPRDKNGCYGLAAAQYLRKKNGLPDIIDPRLYHDVCMSVDPDYQRFGDTYRQMYEIYRLCNQVCWNGALPEHCIIEFATELKRKRANGRRVLATEFDNGLCHDGVSYPIISFNKMIFFLGFSLGGFSFPLLTSVLLHEMVHIWEPVFSIGHFPLHGKHFNDEARRIGIDDVNKTVIEGSLAFRALQHVMQKYPDLCNDLKNLVEEQGSREKYDDVNFFAEQVLHRQPQTV